MTATPPRTALGFDVGERWVGVAIGNAISHSARPLRVLARDQAPFWAQLEGLIGEWKPDALVVGEPLTLDGGEQSATVLARRFARQLSGRFGLPVGLIDERASSREADRRFAEQRRQGLKRRSQADQQDAAAAAIILERWLDAGMPLHSPNESRHDVSPAPPADP